METISRADVLRANPLLRHLSLLGIQLKGTGAERQTNVCAAVKHKPAHLCVTVNPDKEIWRCHDCEIGGSVIDWIAIESGRQPNDVFKELAMRLNGGAPAPKNGARKAAPPVEESESVEPRLIKTYDYNDECGALRYQVCRYVPKTFRQRVPVGSSWKYSMEGVTRVLYNLAAVLTAKEVVIVEGEKDADTLNALGFVATTNVGGGKNWLGAYADTLRGRDVIVVPDTDATGAEHAKAIVESLHDKANSVKVVKLPAKDSTDWFESFKSPDEARAAFRKLFDETPHTIAPLPIYTIAEMEVRYHQTLNESREVCLDLSRFLPSFRCLRPLLPGELAVLMASTGVGKTAIAQTIARVARPLPTLYFQMEIPTELMYERFAQMENGCESWAVEQHYRKHPPGLSAKFEGLQHILVCDQTGLTPAKLDSLIERSALKFGVPPKFVVVDYLGLMRGENGGKRYEYISDCAESLRIIAKRRRVIMLMTVQISRPDKKDDLEVRLTDGKDSGSIENSGSLVLGAWRPERDKLVLKVLKNTKGHSGHLIECNYHGERMSITEVAPVADADLPPPPYKDA